MASSSRTVLPPGNSMRITTWRQNPANDLCFRSSALAESEEGRKLQERCWNELAAKLESVAPGVVNSEC